MGLSVTFMMCALSVRTYYLVGSWWNQPFGCTLFPGFGRQIIFDAFHRDAVLDRTDESAKIAADTMMFIHAGNALKWRDCAGKPPRDCVKFWNRCG